MPGLTAVRFYGPSAGVPQIPVPHSLQERVHTGKAGLVVHPSFGKQGLLPVPGWHTHDGAVKTRQE